MENVKHENKNLVVYGIYPTQLAADSGVARLQQEGFRMADVSVLLSSPETTKEFGHVKASKAPEAGLVGGTSGAVIGGTLGLLAGIGALAIPGVGPLVAAGPIMATLAGTGLGSVTGGLIGALVGLGMPEYEAQRFAGRIQKGGVLVSVHADDNEWRDRAKEILKRTGAEDISSTTEADADFEDDDRPRVYNL